jgi:ABC-type bacteriocin/lantibiotic exporter with double-glycine peptidase domain
MAFAVGARRIERQQIEASSQQQGTLHEILRGVVTLRTSGAAQRGVVRWLARMFDARSAAVRMNVLQADQRLALGALREATQIGTLVWTCHLCLHGQLSVGNLVSLLMLSDQFVQTVSSFGALLTPLMTAQSHLPRIDALLAQPDITRTTGRLPPRHGTSSASAVVLDDVWFRYGPEQPWVLARYSLEVAALSHHALRGPSGAGKSTVLRLIAGLYPPERGTVRVFGCEPGRLRGEVCYLPQNAHLFHGSILHNLRLLSGSSLAAVLDASQQSGLADFVAGLPMGYETVLPSGATTLSGGQRQLIAWTAAMASGRKLVVVDEALSQVDRILRTRLLAMADAYSRTVISVEHEQIAVRPSARS